MLLCNDPNCTPGGDSVSTPDPDTFLVFISQEKVANRILTWKKRDGVDRGFLETIATTRGMPASIKREARTRTQPPERVLRTHTLLIDHGEERLFSREEFYEVVWSTPLSRLAERFGISGNAIRKRCNDVKVCAVRIKPGHIVMGYQNIIDGDNNFVCCKRIA